MANPWAYEPVLSRKAAAYLIALPKVRQRRLIELVEKLAGTPHQVGDYSEQDEQGRAVHFMLIGDLVVSFWADHSEKEFRIVDVEEV